MRQVPFADLASLGLIELRRRVLRAPLGLDFTAEELAAEHEQVHFGAFEGERLVGVLIMVPTGTMAKMRQVAVNPDDQGRGIARAMILASEDWAVHAGFAEIVLHARANVVPMYEKLGYEVFGEPFEEVTIPHRKMRKSLTS